MYGYCAIVLCGYCAIVLYGYCAIVLCGYCAIVLYGYTSMKSLSVLLNNELCAGSNECVRKTLQQLLIFYVGYLHPAGLNSLSLDLSE